MYGYSYIYIYIFIFSDTYGIMTASYAVETCSCSGFAIIKLRVYGLPPHYGETYLYYIL